MASLRGRCGRVSCCTRVLLRHPYAGKPKWRSLLTLSGSTLLSAKFSWSNSLRSWFHGSRDKICATFNMPRSTPKTLNNGEQSLDFTYYEQTTNRFWSPHLAESKEQKRWKKRPIGADRQGQII